MIWLYFLLGIFFIALGFSIHVLKWHFLISGYNLMPKEKKAKVDTGGLGRLIGIYFYVNGGVLIILGMLYALGYKQGIIPAIVFFFVSTAYILVRAQRYDGNIYDEGGKLRQGAWKQLAVPVIIIVITLSLVTVLLFFSSRPTKVSFLDTGIKIHGMYGEVYTWDSIDAVELTEELPAIQMRTNGSAFGSHFKGHFATKELGPVMLFVNANNPPFVLIKTGGRVIIFNMKDADETREAFREIKKEIGK